MGWLSKILAEFRRLLAVTSSRIFGRPLFKTLDEDEEHLLPTGRDPLSASLNAAITPKEWTVPRLTAAASALAGAAQRFIAGFNALFGPELPPASATYAHIFGGQDPHILGRCVRLGQTTDAPPDHYHWAVTRDRDGEYAVHEFWSPDIWTTERYCETHQARRQQTVM